MKITGGGGGRDPLTKIAFFLRSFYEINDFFTMLWRNSRYFAILWRNLSIFCYPFTKLAFFRDLLTVRSDAFFRDSLTKSAEFFANLWRNLPVFLRSFDESFSLNSSTKFALVSINNWFFFSLRLFVKKSGYFFMSEFSEPNTLNF